MKTDKKDLEVFKKRVLSYAIIRILPSLKIQNFAKDTNMLAAVDDILKDVFSTEKLNKLKTDLKEASSGTPIAASSVLTSEDRTKLEHLFYKIRDFIDPKEFGMEFLQNRIEVFLCAG